MNDKSFRSDEGINTKYKLLSLTLVNIIIIEKKKTTSVNDKNRYNTDIMMNVNFYNFKMHWYYVVLNN